MMLCVALSCCVLLMLCDYDAAKLLLSETNLKNECVISVAREFKERVALLTLFRKFVLLDMPDFSNRKVLCNS